VLSRPLFELIRVFALRSTRPRNNRSASMNLRQQMGTGSVLPIRGRLSAKVSHKAD
jgi:hypothetical protein